MLAGLKLVDQEDKKEVEAVEKRASKLKSMPDGALELFWELERAGECRSYCNDRIMWLGWQLEKHGIKVRWYEA